MILARIGIEKGLMPGEKGANEWGPQPPDGINWKRPEKPPSSE
ncbi:hypothetical protein [Qipengyuania gelatinilytica]|nr:hypothetical protein [Qipengyuania gelatinilytica]